MLKILSCFTIFASIFSQGPQINEHKQVYTSVNHTNSDCLNAVGDHFIVKAPTDDYLDLEYEIIEEASQNVNGKVSLTSVISPDVKIRKIYLTEEVVNIGNTFKYILTKIGSHLVANPDLACFTGDLLIPNTVTTIDDYAFECNGGFNSGVLFLSENLVSIGKNAFSGCPFYGSLRIPDFVETIGEGAFANTSFSTVYISNSLKIIDTNVFYLCKQIQSVFLSESIIFIDTDAFSGCMLLQNLHVYGSKQKNVNHDAFRLTSMTKTGTLYCESESLVQDYKNDSSWTSQVKNFISYTKTPTSVTAAPTPEWRREVAVNVAPRAVFVSVKVLPDTCDQSLKYFTSSNPGCVSVDPVTGVCKFLSPGTSKIRVTATGTTSFVETIVTVELPDPQSIALPTQKVNGRINGSETVVAKVIPEGTDQEVVWNSDDPTIATVDNNGKINFIKVGTTTLTCASKNFLSVKAALTVEVQYAVPKSIELNSYLKEGKIGDSPYELIATVLPAAANPKVTWFSSNTAVATVSALGIVSFVNVGTTDIIATSVDAKSVTNKCIITVNPSSPQTIITDTESISTTIGESGKINASVMPTTASQIVSFASNDPTVVTIDNNGNYKCLKNGATSITVATRDPKSPIIRKTIPVSVDFADVIDLELSIYNYDGQYLMPSLKDITVKVLPAGANQDVVWTTSNPDIASVYRDDSAKDWKIAYNGNQFADAELTFTTVGTPSVTKKIIVTTSYAKPTGIRLSKTSAIQRYDETPETITATVLPLPSASQEVVWSSSDTSKVTVDQTGKLTYTGVGNAKVIAKVAADTAITAECDVTINNAKPTSVEAPSEISGYISQKGQIKPTVNPAQASQECRYTTSNESVVKVNGITGEYEFSGVGDASIVVSTVDTPIKSAECKVHVSSEPPQSVNITPNTINNRLDETPPKLLAKVEPATAEQKIIWETQNENIVTVDANGNLKYVGVGTTKIIVKVAADTAITAECNVTLIYSSPQSVVIDKEIIDAEVNREQEFQINGSIIPATASQEIVWTSANEAIAEVTQTGKVITKGVYGTTTIKASSKADNKLFKVCSVDVIYQPATNVKIQQTDIEKTFEEGLTLEFTSIVNPTGASQSVTWSSFDINVIEIDSKTGIAKVLTFGKTIIRCTSNSNPDLIDEINIHILDPSATTGVGMTAIIASSSISSLFVALLIVLAIWRRHWLSMYIPSRTKW